MLKAVLVDDERPALRVLEILLQNFAEISVAGSFTNPNEAIRTIGQIKPDVVFLDICMPQLQGLDAASMILDGSPDTDVVFVTAFDRYAVDAFELNALDYILKPVNTDRLGKTVERMVKKRTLQRKDSGKRLQIKCFGQLEVGWENDIPIKWRAEKTKELFAFLLLNEGRALSKEELLETLWTNNTPERAIRQLYNGVYYIRKTLQEYGIGSDLIALGNCYRMKLGDVDYDVKRFHEYKNNSRAYSLNELKKLEQLYAGDYLGCEYYEWANSERERLLGIYQNLLFRLSGELIGEKNWEDAEAFLLKAYNRNPYDERATKLLLEVYLSLGNVKKALKHYDTYKELLKKDLGVVPTERIMEYVRRIK